MKIATMKTLETVMPAKSLALAKASLGMSAAHIEEGGMVTPFLAMESKLFGKKIVSLDGMPDDRAKVAEVLRKLLREAEVDRYAFVSECWAATCHADDKEMQKIRPRDREDRTEVLQAIFVEKGEEPVIVGMSIERLMDGTTKVVDSDPMRGLASDGDEADIQTPWSTLLDEEDE